LIINNILRVGTMRNFFFILFAILTSVLFSPASAYWGSYISCNFTSEGCYPVGTAYTCTYYEGLGVDFCSHPFSYWRSTGTTAPNTSSGKMTSNGGIYAGYQYLEEEWEFVGCEYVATWTTGSKTWTVYAVAPVASFTATPLTSTAPLTVNFTDQSTNYPTSGSWNFGDGGMSMDLNATHTYTTPGTYSVNHSATNSAGTGWENKIAYISVTAPTLTAAIRDSADQTAVTNANVSLYNWAATATTYADASTGSAVWTVLASGNIYQIRADAPGYQSYAENYTHPGGNPTMTVSMVREDPLVANFTGLPLSGPAPLNVTFTDTSTASPTSWNWSFGDGGISAERNPSHNYTETGTYSVNLTTANAAGSDAEEKSGYVVVTSPVACDVTGPYVDFVIENVSQPNCDSPVWKRAVCYDNVLIRWARAGQSAAYYSTLSPWMWKRNLGCPDPGHSYALDLPYNKPVYVVAVTNPDEEVDWFHAVAAELLTDENPQNSTWPSWKFFQYDNLNITIGDWQIPVGGTSFWTTVDIQEIVDFPACGQYRADSRRIFYIAQNGSVFLHPRDYYLQGYRTSQNGMILYNKQDISEKSSELIKSIALNDQFSINDWEFDPNTKEFVVYVHDIKDEHVIDSYQNKTIGDNTVRIVYDKEFEINRVNVEKQLFELKKDSDYQISWIGMVTHTMSEPSEKSVEMWVYKSTPQNQKMDGTVIQGWTIHVYPMSK